MTTLYRKIVDAIVSENKEQAAHQFGVAMAHAVKEQLEDFKAAVGQKIFESVGETNNTFIPVKQDFTIEAIDPAKKNDRMPKGEPVKYKVNAWSAAKAYNDAAYKGHTNIKVTDHAGNDVTSQVGLKEDVAEGFVDPSTYHRELGKYGPEVVANTYKDKFGTENVEHTVDGRNVGIITQDLYGRKIHFLHGYGASRKNASSLDESMKLVSKHGDGQHTAKVYKDSDWGEYRVKFFKDGKHVGEDGDYHTDDLDDAKSTADSQIKRYQMNEALDNGPGKIKAPKVTHGQTRSTTGYTKSHEELAQIRDAQRPAPAAPKEKASRLPKPIDQTAVGTFRAFEKHIGGKFEHYESDPQHGYVTLPDGRKAASMTATVTHSYGEEDDLGLEPGQVAAESYRVKLVRHPDHGLVVHHLPRSMNESTYNCADDFEKAVADNNLKPGSSTGKISYFTDASGQHKGAFNRVTQKGIIDLSHTGSGMDLSDRLIEGVDIDAQFSKWKNDLAAQHPEHIKSGKVKFLSHPDAPNTVSAEVGDRTLGIFNHKTGETQVFTESVTPASVVKSHIENLLADKDINATVTDSSVKVHKSNVQRAKKLLDRHGYSHKVESGLNEDTATALEASKEAAREAAEEQSKAKAPTIQDVVSVLGNTVSVADIGAAQ